MTIVPNATVVFQIITFLILMFVLNAFLFKPMMRVLEERRARTVGRREKAAKADAKAGEIWKDYQAKITDARAEAEKGRLELVRQGEIERSRITETASAEAEKTVTELKARVADEAVKAKEVLKAEIQGMSRQMAEKIIGRAV